MTVYPFTSRRVFSRCVSNFPSIFRRKSAARTPTAQSRIDGMTSEYSWNRFESFCPDAWSISRRASTSRRIVLMPGDSDLHPDGPVPHRRDDVGIFLEPLRELLP